MQASFVVAFQFAHQLLSHGTDLEVMLLKGVCLERLKQLQSIRITESIQTTQAHLHTTNNIDCKCTSLLSYPDQRQGYAEIGLLSLFIWRFQG